MTRLPFLPRSPNLRLNIYKPVYGRKVAILEHLADAGNPPFKFLLSAPMVSCAGSQARMNVLIVEDSRFLRISNERALQKAGYDVITAADGEEGLRLAIERKPDLVILDLMLPKLPGYEVLRELRKRPETAAMPVMIVSSLPQSNDQKLLDQGATSYFEGSCWTRALIFLFKTCARCSPKRKPPRSARPPAPKLKFSPTLPIPFSKRRGDHLNILIVDDSRLLRL